MSERNQLARTKERLSVLNHKFQMFQTPKLLSGVYEYVFVGVVGVYTHMPVEARSQHSVPPSIFSPPSFLRKGLLLNMELTVWLDWLASETLRILLSPLLQL